MFWCQVWFWFFKVAKNHLRKHMEGRGENDCPLASGIMPLSNNNNSWRRMRCKVFDHFLVSFNYKLMMRQKWRWGFWMKKRFVGNHVLWILLQWLKNIGHYLHISCIHKHEVVTYVIKKVPSKPKHERPCKLPLMSW